MKQMALAVMMVVGAIFSYSPTSAQEVGGSEQQAMAQTLQYAMEYNKTSEAAAWVNPDTDNTGTAVPIKTYVNADGLYCREFITTIIIGGEEQQGYGTACRQPDGTWQIVAADSQDPSTAGYQTVIENNYYYPYAYPYWYDHYPYYVWDPFPSFFFSFDIVHFHHHHHFKAHSFGFHHVRPLHVFHGTKRAGGVQRFHGAQRVDGATQVRGTVKSSSGSGNIRADTVRQNRGGQTFDGSRRFHGNQGSGGNINGDARFSNSGRGGSGRNDSGVRFSNSGSSGGGRSFDGGARFSGSGRGGSGSSFSGGSQFRSGGGGGRSFDGGANFSGSGRGSGGRSFDGGGRSSSSGRGGGGGRR
jgi:surface antigen